MANVLAAAIRRALAGEGRVLVAGPWVARGRGMDRRHDIRGDVVAQVETGQPWRGRERHVARVLGRYLSTGEGATAFRSRSAALDATDRVLLVQGYALLDYLPGDEDVPGVTYDSEEE